MSGFAKRNPFDGGWTLTVEATELADLFFDAAWESGVRLSDEEIGRLMGPFVADLYALILANYKNVAAKRLQTGGIPLERDADYIEREGVLYPIMKRKSQRTA